MLRSQRPAICRETGALMGIAYLPLNRAEVGDAHDKAPLDVAHSNLGGRIEETAGSQAATRHVLKDILARLAVRRVLGGWQLRTALHFSP